MTNKNITNISYKVPVKDFMSLLDQEEFRKEFRKMTEREQKEVLQKLYSAEFNQFICDLLGVTKPTLTKKLTELGIKLKGKGNREKKSKL